MPSPQTAPPPQPGTPGGGSWETWGPPIAAGVLSFVGGERGNQARSKEARLDRSFQERMRNSQWQAAVADMEAAGLNPALAYSQGPNASPGGSMAQQMDTLSPAISSGMQAKRMQADLQLLRKQTEKITAEGDSAKTKAFFDKAQLEAYGIEISDGKLLLKGRDGALPWLTRKVKAEVANAEQLARKQGLTGDIMAPLAQLMDTMGMWAPILGLVSQFMPGGIAKGGGSLLAKGRNIFQGKRLPFKRR